MHFKKFLSLILKEKELKQKQICIAFSSCFVQSKADLYIQKKKKVFKKKKKISNLPTLIFFRL